MRTEECLFFCLFPMKTNDNISYISGSIRALSSFKFVNRELAAAQFLTSRVELRARVFSGSAAQVKCFRACFVSGGTSSFTASFTPQEEKLVAANVYAYVW